MPVWRDAVATGADDASAGLLADRNSVARGDVMVVADKGRLRGVRMDATGAVATASGLPMLRTKAATGLVVAIRLVAMARTSDATGAVVACRGAPVERTKAETGVDDACATLPACRSRDTSGDDVACSVLALICAANAVATGDVVAVSVSGVLVPPAV